ncbi:MAG: hypothetical protein CMJ83_11195 [Planctomycetes bacterium]|nr:hypothetical protein [Planctomycetota bacterium]
METVTLYRPTGPRELKLVEDTGFLRWPPRLPEQPIFYPVANERYATEIASRWNVKDSGSGFVTRFEVKREFMDRYQIQIVGASHHAEWWIPAEDLEELNDNLVGRIQIIASLGDA